MNHIVYIVIFRPLLQIWDTIWSCNWHTWGKYRVVHVTTNLDSPWKYFCNNKYFFFVAIKYFRRQQCFGQLNGARLLSVKSNWSTLFGFNQHKLGEREKLRNQQTPPYSWGGDTKTVACVTKVCESNNHNSEWVLVSLFLLCLSDVFWCLEFNW